MCVCLHQAGMGGHYVLDEYGDRDANFSMIYTNENSRKVRQQSVQQYDHAYSFCFVCVKITDPL